MLPISPLLGMSGLYLTILDKDEISNTVPPGGLYN